MKAKNLISVLHGHETLYSIGTEESGQHCYLKKHEVETLRSFYDLIKDAGCSVADFDGYHVGYTIKQIGKEFDLLRLGKDYILNIELKQEQTEEKILAQMQKNYYYLKILGKPINIFTYVKEGKAYKYKEQEDAIQEVEIGELAQCIKGQLLDQEIDPDMIFLPSQYLISPFNSTEKFLNNEYFLTDAQQKIEIRLEEMRNKEKGGIFCLSANAGTGKTLLIYDYAKKCNLQGKRVTIIHCGKLNAGHEKLIRCSNLNILPIKKIGYFTTKDIVEGADVLIVDEAQRIHKYQLDLILDEIMDKNIISIFSYDIKQFLHATERKDIYEIALDKYPDATIERGVLKNKIRTNKELASFVKNLFDIGSSNGYMNYGQVSVDYIDDLDELTQYLEYLEEKDWTAITYTVSQYQKDTNDEIFKIVNKTAHDVIGQEFTKVAVVMNQSFGYNEQNKLVTKRNYYSSYGMLYQIVTRVVDELKIIVYKNPRLYLKLLEIKEMGKK